ncbi:MAG: lytic transglycosylase domain-containing protein [Rhizobiaceae bacterium]
MDYPKDEEPTSDPIPVEAYDAIVPECGPSPINATGIKALVEEAAIRHGVDPGFAVAIVATESDFDRNRNSPKGARGPMQLMPATADRFDVDQVCDPAANIDGGVRYLRILLNEFGNPLLAAAAYNAGEHRIYEYGGIPPFAETVSYVAKVVNHQLGLPMPSARKMARSPGTPEDEAPDVGVVAPKRTGTFVAGVMHF